MAKKKNQKKAEAHAKKSAVETGHMKKRVAYA